MNSRFKADSSRPAKPCTLESRKTPKQRSTWRTDITLRTFLIASATLLSLGAVAVPANADGSTIHVEQYGWDNEFGGSQNGHRIRITHYQNGYGNSSINAQTGAHNRAVVGQEGYGNSADTLQLGRRNIVGVAQFGSGHTAVTTQDGTGNAIGVIQAGHNNDAHVTQVGHGNVSIIVQDSPTYRREERARAQPLALTQ